MVNAQEWISKMVEEDVKLVRIELENRLRLERIELENRFSSERIELEKRLKQFETEILARAMRSLEDPSLVPDPRNLELQFLNQISQPISTGEEIKGLDNTCIEVVLLDSTTRAIVDIGPVASSKVEMVALENSADDEKIVQVEGKLPLLEGNECTLEGGRGVFKNVKFRHHATAVKPPVFRLGARIVGKFDGIAVKVAKTVPFKVESYRKKYSKKINVPNLESKIWELKNIQRYGKIHERLQSKNIDTVGQFLIQLLINHQELQNIAGMKGKNWEDTVSHARKCQSDRMYCYVNSHKNDSAVVFDIFGKLQGLCSEGKYAAANMLSENKKVDAEKLLSSAREHWENVIPFDDPDSLQQHLSAVETSFNPSSSGTPGRRDACPDTGASKMIDASMDGKCMNPLIDHPRIHTAGVGTSEHCDSFDPTTWPDQFSYSDFHRTLNELDI